jgi:hypothetical protein
MTSLSPEQAAEIERLKAYSLNANEILASIPHSRVVLYRELSATDSILDQVRAGPIVLLYPIQSDMSGHWTLLWVNRRGDDAVINYFCPYSSKIDQIIYDRRTPGFTYPTLSRLLLQQGLQIRYNEFPLQKLCRSINTCGRWVIVRYQFADLTEEEFNQIFGVGGTLQNRTGLDPDTIVTILTRHIGP